ncbi:hypothetical protein ACP3V3_20835 [Vibrio sp. PNB22_3_1]
MSHFKIAKLSAAGQVVRVIAGPIVLLFIGSSLSIDEKTFYFTFFNLVALQQVLEMGVGYTTKQYIAHSLDSSDNVTKETQRYYYFSKVWFVGVSLSILFLVGFGGYKFLDSYQGNVNWQTPWLFLVVTSSVASILIPIQILLEGAQNQAEVFRAKLCGTLFGTVSTIVSLILDFGLYSPVVGVLINTVVTNLMMLRSFCELNRKLQIWKDNNFTATFAEVFPLLSRISITWLVGYALWNSFNLIAFKTLTMQDSALLGMTLALSRAGYSIADSVVTSQLTIFGNAISKGKTDKAIRLFYKYLFASVVLLLLGYGIFTIFVFKFSFLNINEMVLSFGYTVQIMLFSFFILLVSTINNYCRCFKKDPNFINSLFLNLSVPITCYYSFTTSSSPSFVLVLIPVAISVLWSIKNLICINK